MAVRPACHRSARWAAAASSTSRNTGGADVEPAGLVDLVEVGLEPSTFGDGPLQALSERGHAEMRIHLAAGHDGPPRVGRVVDVIEVVLGVEERERLPLEPEGAPAGLEHDLRPIRLQAAQVLRRLSDLPVGLRIGRGPPVVPRMVRRARVRRRGRALPRTPGVPGRRRCRG